MKNLSALIVGLTCLTITAQAQKIALTKVPAEVKSSFAKATYEAEVNGKDLIFDTKGNPIE